MARRPRTLVAPGVLSTQAMPTRTVEPVIPPPRVKVKPHQRKIYGHQRQQRVAPAALKAPARAKIARIIVTNNNAGLTRDSAIVAQAFRRAGWDVCFATPKMKGQLQHVTVNVHLEILAERMLGAAHKNIVIPNPEWWSAKWTPALAQPSVSIWAKTEDAIRAFNGVGRAIERVGFCSRDQRDVSVPRERTFLHVSGASPNKGTDRLISCWRADWPHLTIVSSIDRASRANVTVLQHVSDDVLRGLQNRHMFHIYPSRYEGFGHAQWEGLSCGAIVFVTDGPPFDEYPNAFRLLAATPKEQAANHLVTMYDVKEEAFAEAVRWAKMSEEALAAHREQARVAWESATNVFAERIARVIAATDAAAATAAPVVFTTMLSAARRSNVLADLPPFTYVGRVNCVTGYGAAARHQIHVLRRHGARFAIVDAGSTHDPDPQRQDPFVQAARKSDVEGQTRGTIIHLAPNSVAKWRHLPRPHILVSVWETTRLPAEWVRTINTFDQVWCATEWQRKVYRDSGVTEKLLRVVPFVVDPELYRSQATPRASDGETVFGSVFQWTERKAPAALIGAYLQAFTADDHVTLLLKSYEGDSPTTGVEGHVASIVKGFHLQKSPPKIRVVTQPLSSLDMTAFYQSIDCYVSSHRGEGFGLPIAEALLSGRPVIATGWSAPAEYAEGIFRAVRYTLQPPHGMHWQPFYSVDQSWAQPDVADLAEAMREARAGRLDYSLDRVRDQFTVLVDRAGASAAAALRGLS